IEKIILFSLINSVLAFYLAKAMLGLRMAPILLLPVALNFYLLVLFFAAERLKTSLTFLMIGITLKGAKTQILFLVFAILSHFQSVFLIFARFSKLISNATKNFLKGRFYRRSFGVVLLLGAAILFFLYFRDPLT